LPYVLQGAAAVTGGISTGVSAYGAAGKLGLGKPPAVGPVAKAAGVVPRAGYLGPAY